MSSNWKLIGRNSGNMSHHRNVASNKLNYENGKWDSIYDISGIKKKGYTFDICGENIVVGIGTPKPFSRLSLGAVVADGQPSIADPGRLAAVAVHETSSGGNFKGILYNSQLVGETVGTTTTGLQIMASDKSKFNIDDPSAGKIYIASDNITTIGGETRIANSNGGIPAGLDIGDVNGNTKIVLDIRGSIRTDGYINFFDKPGTDPVPDGDFWNETDAAGTGTITERWKNIPVGSLWLKGVGGNETAEGLYYKKQDGSIQYIDPTGGGGGGSTTGGAFDASFSSVPPFIIQKAPSTQNNKSGGVNIIIDGFPTTTPSDGTGFNNLL